MIGAFDSTRTTFLSPPHLALDLLGRPAHLASSARERKLQLSRASIGWIKEMVPRFRSRNFGGMLPVGDAYVKHPVGVGAAYAYAKSRDRRGKVSA